MELVLSSWMNVNAEQVQYYMNFIEPEEPTVHLLIPASAEAEITGKPIAETLKGSGAAGRFSLVTFP
ncbi:hypothetical protein EOD41_16045 [Mucilaginibacter limnophilus]|uniref:Uncharacterized protein n=1 Tax=Mucilaginibacter limnophilus TaxID=1932778 RepID=A0A437MQM6_9SPHI|nr:hypothetical protein [Mucilaginibacter limnophilus]RVT99949.1 hypothetical protein EOD41_16045 [Mucilaginibacter limnophilus]